MPTKLKVIMFTDREGSSTDATNLGDATRARVNRWQDQFTREIASETRAMVVKFLGDGHLLTFDDAVDSIRAGLRLQRRVQEYNAACPVDEQFRMRIGIHVGSVEVDDAGDVRGHAADMAKRVESAGKGQRDPVLFTNRVRDLLPPKAVRHKKFKTITLSGDDKPTVLYQALDCAGEEPGAFRNPFIVGGPIVNPSDFWGREREIKFAFTRLRGMQSVSVVGERRIGKTSLLHYLAHTVQERLGLAYRPAFLDLLHPSLRSVSGVVAEIQRQLGLNDHAATLGGFCDRMAQLHADNVRPLILIDEMEVFIRLPAEFSRDFFEALRAVASIGQVALVTASRMSLQTMHAQGSLVSPLHNIMGKRELGLFTEAEAGEFVTAPRPGLKFTRQQVGEILARGQRQPLRLQILCWHVAQANHDKRTDQAEVWAEAEVEVRAMLDEGQTATN
ncbi:MAG: AAA family ATPase [Verrucomicrobiota bacterium]